MVSSMPRSSLNCLDNSSIGSTRSRRARTESSVIAIAHATASVCVYESEIGNSTTLSWAAISCARPVSFAVGRPFGCLTTSMSCGCEARAERLEHRLFGGETCCVMRCGGSGSVAISALGFAEHLAYEAGRSCENLLHALDLHEVDAKPDLAVKLHLALVDRLILAGCLLGCALLHKCSLSVRFRRNAGCDDLEECGFV